MCKKDICAEPDHEDVLCEVADEYAKHCLEKGICLEYRSTLSCSKPSCGAGSEYQECGAGCDPTCDQEFCNTPARPGCRCSKDMVSSSTKFYSARDYTIYQKLHIS